MKRAQFMVGLAVLLGLATGGAQLVFGQRSDKTAPPIPSKLPVTGIVAPMPPKGIVLPEPPSVTSPPAQTKGISLPLPPPGGVLPMPSSEPDQSAPVLGGLAPLPPPMPGMLDLPLPQSPTVQTDKSAPALVPSAVDQLTVVPMPPSQPLVPAASQTTLPQTDLKVSSPASQSPPLLPTKPPVGLLDQGPALGGLVLPSTKPGSSQSEVKPLPLELVPEIPGTLANANNPTGRQEPAVSLEWVGPPAARLNQPTGFQIIAKNISGGAVHNVIVRYRIPQGVKVTAQEPRALAEGSVLTWDLGTMSPSQEKRIDLQLLPEAKVVITCQASVTFTGSSSHTVYVREPKLTIKATAPANVIQGDLASVSINVSNPGDGAAERVRVQALLPEGLEHARGKTFELDLGTLAPGESRSVQVACLARSSGSQIVECMAVADAGLSAKDSARVDVVIPRLDLVVGAPKVRYLDRPATFSIKVTNPGSAPASNVAVTHQLTQGFKFQAASHGGRHDAPSRSVAWFIGDLGPGESREVMLEAVAVNLGEHKQQSVATAARGLKTECESVTRIEGLSALLMELVDTDDPVEVGADTSYEIRVTNTGSKTETNLELVCTIPEKMEFRAAKCAAGCTYRVEGRDVIFEMLPRLAPRADVVYRIVVRGTAPGDLRFRARIRADGLSEPVLREESTRVYGDDGPGKSQSLN